MKIKDIKQKNLVLGQVFDDFSRATQYVDYSIEDLCSYVINNSNVYYWLNIESVWGPMGFTWTVLNEYGQFSASNNKYTILPKVPDGYRIKKLNKLISSLILTRNKDNPLTVLKSDWSSLESLNYISTSVNGEDTKRWINADFTDSLSEQNDTTIINNHSGFELNLKYNGYINIGRNGDNGNTTSDSVIIIDDDNVDKLLIGNKNKDLIIDLEHCILWKVKADFDNRRIYKCKIWTDRVADSTYHILFDNQYNNNYIIDFNLINLENHNKSFIFLDCQSKENEHINIKVIGDKNNVAGNIFAKYKVNTVNTNYFNIEYDVNVEEIFQYKCCTIIDNWDDFDINIINKLKSKKYNHTGSYGTGSPNYLFYNTIINTNDKNNEIIDLSNESIIIDFAYSNNVTKTLYNTYTGKYSTYKIVDNKLPKIKCNELTKYNTDLVILDIEFNKVYGYGSYDFLQYVICINPINIQNSISIPTYIYILYKNIFSPYITFKITNKANIDSYYANDGLDLTILYKDEDNANFDDLHLNIFNITHEEDVDFDTNTKIGIINYINNISAILEYPVYIVKQKYANNSIKLTNKATNYVAIKNANIDIDRDMDVEEITSFCNAFKQKSLTQQLSITIISTTYAKFTTEQIQFIVSKGYDVIEKIS